MENIENKIKTTPRDFFVFIGAMVALYTGAVSFINLLFEIINASFPDALNFSYDNFSSGMRWSIASLIIIFPIYIFLSWFINKDLTANFLKKNLGIRKWLTYLTLFVAGVAIITDLIMLINTFLGGEITARFAFKILAVLVVAGTVFAYYLYDLQNIQYQIVNFYQRKGNLPNNLDELKDPIAGFIIPLDPANAISYGYEKVSDLGFKLCADFSLDSDRQTDSKYMTRPMPISSEAYFINENWQHQKGVVCFDRKIDKDLYPILKNPKM